MNEDMDGIWCEIDGIKFVVNGEHATVHDCFRMFCEMVNAKGQREYTEKRLAKEVTPTQEPK